MSQITENIPKVKNGRIGLLPDVKTHIISCHEPEATSLASTEIRNGNCVVVPTETIYGLCCDALNADAVSRLYRIKGRDIRKPSSVFVAGIEEISSVAEVSSLTAEKIIGRYLPGPLTVVLASKHKDLPGVVGTDGKIGIRVSTHPFIQSLCHSARTPLIATSANLSGAADCRTEQDVKLAFDGIVGVIVLESTPMAERATTVVDLCGEQPVLLREGTIPFSELLNFAEGML